MVRIEEEIEAIGREWKNEWIEIRAKSMFTAFKEILPDLQSKWAEVDIETPRVKLVQKDRGWVIDFAWSVGKNKVFFTIDGEDVTVQWFIKWESDEFVIPDSKIVLSGHIDVPFSNHHRKTMQMEIDCLEKICFWVLGFLTVITK